MSGVRIYRQDVACITFFDLHTEREIILYENQMGRLLAVQNNGYRLVVKGNLSIQKDGLLLKDGMHFLLEDETGNIRFFVKELKKETFEYIAYALEEREIKIGRSEKNDICISSPYISRLHASISFKENFYYVSDEDSRNGCYVNNIRMQEMKLACGDVIWLGNIMMIIGKDEILIPKEIEVKSNLSYALRKEETGSTEKEVIFVYDPVQKFHATLIEAELPMKKANADVMPAIYVLGPSITMGLSSTAMGLFSLWSFLHTNENLSAMIPSLIMALSMAMATILWPIVSKRYEYRQRIRKEEHRRYLYLSYLDDLKNQIEEAVRLETIYQKENYPKLSDTYSKMIHKHILHQRKKGDIDWLCIGIGFGSKKAVLQLEIPSISSFEQDDLIDRLLHIYKSDKIIDDIVLQCDLKENKYLQVTGQKEESIDFMLMMLLQVVMLHASNTVKVVILAEQKMMRKEKIFALSHIFYGHERLWICDFQSCHRVRSLLYEIIEDQKIEEIIVFSFDMEEYLTRLSSLKCDKLHVVKWNSESYPILGDIRLNNGYLTWKDNNKHYQIQKIDSEVRRKLFLQFSKSFSFSQEESIDFLSLWDVHLIEELQIRQRWRNSDVSTSLKTVIGRDEYQGLLYLDAHEHAHGPHGLLAGMTGSGKSECLLTYLLSLAISYSYDDVNFLLIDFKGGTMASALEALPHTAGVITNLDEGMLMRCLTAIESELTRRQKRLSEIGKKYHISSMDIDKYQQLRKLHSIEPMPHLFIVADEFAQLKQLFPAFLDHLRQCARIGRSLGIHLLLATQKPFGIVDEQIWSNSRFRLCLKVAQRNDSIDMLKKEDAVYLKQLGQFCFQVGNDEVYLQARSAWTQAPYIPDINRCINQITYLNEEGRITTWEKEYKEVTKTQLEVICDAICKEAQNRQPHKLWKPFLPKVLLQKTLNYQGNDICMGLIDDIKQQEQYPFTISLKQQNNIVICGMAQSGKSTFIETLIQNCLITNACILYLFDFDRPILKKYEKYHTVACVFEKEDTDRIQNFFYLMKSFIAERRKNPQKEIILCVIHNYEAFHENYGEWEDELLYLLREGKKYNILICISTTSIYQIPLRFHGHIENRYMLYGTIDEYSYAFHTDKELIPLHQAGCGLLKQKDEVYMFQVAIFQKERWINCDQSDTDKKYLLKEIPKQVSHTVERNCKNVFMGIDLNTREEVFWKEKNLFILSAFRFFEPFLHLFLKSIEQNQHVHYIGKTQSIHHKSETIETYTDYLNQKEMHIFIWIDAQIQISDSDDLQKLFHHPLHRHIFIETISNIQSYKIYDWFQPLFMYADVLWMGRGFQNYAYELNKQTLNQKLKENEAFYWEDEICRVIQLWEVEENG